jgi:hypothetical protein
MPLKTSLDTLVSDLLVSSVFVSTERCLLIIVLVVVVIDVDWPATFDIISAAIRIDRHNSPYSGAVFGHVHGFSPSHCGNRSGALSRRERQTAGQSKHSTKYRQVLRNAEALSRDQARGGQDKQSGNQGDHLVQLEFASTPGRGSL